MAIRRSAMTATAVMCTVALLGLRSTASAQDAHALPPIRQLGPRVATTIDTIGSIDGVRELSVKASMLDSLRRRQDSVLRAQTASFARADSVARAQGKPIQPHVTRATVYGGPSDLPDYMPFLRSSAVRADLDNNLWIQQAIPAGATIATYRATYDIVNRQGRLIDRVQLPASLTLVGFGRGAVYLTSRDGWGTVLLEYRLQ